MAEYIERKSALEICEKEYQDRLRMLDYCGDTVAWNIAAEINAIPSADVAPVVHGRWVEKPYLIGTSRFCSVCGENYGMPHGVYRYCPNCGAKMDGRE